MGLLRKGFSSGRAYLRNHLATRKQRIFFSLGLLILSFCLYLLISLLSIGRSTLALGALAKSYRQEKVCHEECSVWRQAQEKEIVVDLKLDLKKKRQKLVKRILNYWQAEGGDLEFKKELVHIMSLAYGEENRPEYLGDYLVDSEAEQSLVREIISQFNIEKISQQNLSSNLLDKIKNATSSQEKIEALKTLGKLNNDQEINNYFFILSSDESLELKREAIKNISAVLDKKSFFTLSQLELISNLVLALEIDSRLRQDLVLLLGDYYLVFPIETEKIWRGVYVKKDLDNISRLFSADNLNHLTGTDLILPEISPSEWESYYNK